MCFGEQDKSRVCDAEVMEGTLDCVHRTCKRNKFTPPAAVMCAAPAKPIKKSMRGQPTWLVFFHLPTVNVTCVSRPNRTVLETELMTTVEYAEFLQDVDRGFPEAARVAEWGGVRPRTTARGMGVVTGLMKGATPLPRLP